jgi:hypothetical protein
MRLVVMFLICILKGERHLATSMNYISHFIVWFYFPPSINLIARTLKKQKNNKCTFEDECAFVREEN